MANPKTKYAQRHHEAALDHFEQGQFDKALDQIRKAIANDPHNPDYHSTMGIFYHKMNDLTLAIEAYRKAILAKPGHAFAHFNLGLIFMKLGKAVDAIKEWEAVLKDNPQDVDAIFNIAVALAQVGRVKDSIPFYQKVLRLSPDHVQTHQNLGIIFRDDQDYNTARFHLVRLRELDTTYAEVVENELRKCQEQEFLKSLQRPVGESGIMKSVTPGSDPETRALAAILDGEFQMALDLVEAVLANSPDHLASRIMRGQALTGLGQHNDAIAQFLAITAEHPDCVEAYFHLGNIFLGLNDLEKALGSFERVRRLDPAFPLVEENIVSLRQKLQLQNT